MRALRLRAPVFRAIACTVSSALATSGKTSHLFFVASSPGLEPALGQELAELGLPGKELEGGVELRGTTEDLWRTCLSCRLGESVRVRLRPFRARDFDALRTGLERLPWHAYLPRDVEARVDVTCHRSRLWHSDAVRERVLDVLAARRGVRPASDKADDPERMRVFVRLEHDQVQVSIDASGERLHRRGYRTHVAEASLRETLAAALVRFSAPRGERAPVLWDPFCGAGTILCEWLEAELGRLPGARRTFAFERFPTHDAAVYEALRARLSVETSQGIVPHAFGSDIDPKAIAAARSNAESAGLSGHVTLLGEDFERAADRVPRGATVITNPPYGVRIEEGNVLSRLSRVLSVRTDLRPVVLLLGGEARRHQSGLSFITVAKTKNGGLPVRVDRLAAR